MVTLKSEDYERWKLFRMDNKSSITREELEVVSRLHSKYYKHKYYIPCSCSPRTINQWIADINKIWENGNN